MLVDHEERVTPWRAFGHNGVARVRIWQRLTPFGMFQRHEWEMDSGSRQADRWIVGGPRWCEGAACSKETLPSEPDLMRAALEAIAAGHNDARGLATETLQAAGLAA